MNVLAAALGALLFGGVWLIVAGFRARVDFAPKTTAGPGRITLALRRAGRSGRRRAAWLGVGLGLGLVGAYLTGWPLMIVIVPVTIVVMPILLGQAGNHDIDMLQALDRWVRGLLAILPTGRSIADAIRVSARQAPDQLAGPLRLLISRLDDRWPIRQALLAMTDDLDSPDADAVLAALALAAERGGTGAGVTMAALADTIQERLKALREIETERAKPRIVVRQVTAITATVLAAALLFGRSFFAPYGTPEGQLILAALLGIYVGSLVMLRRMTLPRRRERVVRGVS